MPHFLAHLAEGALRPLGLALTDRQQLQSLRDFESDVSSLLDMPAAKLARLVALRDRAKSQLMQELFVLSELDFRENGYFVDFGAADGVEFNNSWLLENEFGWKGIVAEPAQCWREALVANRRCHVETDCVWRESNATLQFTQPPAAALSTISAFRASDFHAEGRKHGETYAVKTISLNDLLAKYGAPETIDYLSIDTEGSEYDILSHFAFDKYNVRMITCEHNYTPLRGAIYDLLTARGFTRKYTGFSKWDDWYVGPK